MKKAIVFILLAAIPLMIFASIGIGNDCWTNGFSQNYDDNLTYSLHLKQDIKNVSLEADYNVYTFKQEGKRYDILDLTASSYAQSGLFCFKGKMGFEIKGNLGAAFMQNKLHEIANITTVHLDYENSTIFYPILETEAYLDFFITPVAKMYFSDGYNLGGGAKLSNKTHTLQVMYNHDFKNTEDSVKVSYEYNAGLINVLYTADVLTNLGYTKLFVSPMKKLSGDKNVYYGFYFIDGEKFLCAELLHRFRNNMEIFANVKYATGEYLGNVQVRKEDNYYSLGLGYNLKNIALRAYAGTRYFELRDNNVRTEKQLDFSAGLEGQVCLYECKAFKARLTAGFDYSGKIHPYFGIGAII